MSGARAGNAPGTRGFALIVVLWFLVLITAICTFVLTDARMQVAIARNIRSSARAEALADAGIAEAIFNQSDPAAGNHWPADGSAHILPLFGGELTLHIADENAKINPNYASAQILTALFEAAGLDSSRSQGFASAIAGWVAAQSEAQRKAADDATTTANSRTSRDGPIEAVDEIAEIAGMTSPVFALLRPYLTVYTDDTFGNPLNASPVVRQALAKQAADRDAAADDMSEPVLEITATARFSDGAVFIREAVVKLDPESPKGYAILDWRRGALPN